MHGRRLSAAAVLELTDAMLATTVADELLTNAGHHFELLDPPPCPIAVYWSERDRVFPEQIYGAVARERIPGAQYQVLAAVGHVPMIDDPAVVAAAISTTIATANHTDVPGR